MSRITNSAHLSWIFIEFSNSSCSRCWSTICEAFIPIVLCAYVRFYTDIYIYIYIFVYVHQHVNLFLFFTSSFSLSANSIKYTKVSIKENYQDQQQFISDYAKAMQQQRQLQLQKINK